MSKFKCDICNGDILMQANKTGVCSKCGMSYDIEAIRAMVSAESEQSNESYQPAENKGKDVIDRDSLLIYLNDLRIMESIVNESNSTIISLTNESNKKKTELEKEKEEKPVKPVEKNVDSRGYGYLVGLIIFLIIMVLCCIPCSKYLGSFGPIVSIIILFFPICLIFFEISSISKSKEEKIVYEEEMLEKTKEYEEKINQYEEKTKQLEISCNAFNEKAEKSTASIQNDINETTELLQKAYSANIIPLQFRNIQGVYYLYDYLSTSNQTLSEALMQCNLEAIKEKLDNVIKLQSKSIIQQAQANAEIMAQNERILSAAQATMQNTAEAAKYAQISAVNSALSLKLQSKSLAYQKADYWLK